MFIKPGQRRDVPALPLVVRMPNGRLLRPAGEKVPGTTFWYRRLRDGDVVIADTLQSPALPPVASAQRTPAAAAPALVAGEPLRLTAAEWARVPELGPPDGPAVVGEGLATAEAIHDRDPAAPLITHDEYLAETRK
jgi:Protein of unknown function (DUF2635)